MIDFINDAGCKTDLVTVGSITCGSGGNDFSLGKFAFNGFAYGFKRVCRTGKTHCAVNIGTAGKRVADCAADTGCRAAERFDFGGVVVGLVFEKKEPGLFFAVGFDFNFNGAGVDFFGFVEFIEFSVFFKIFYRKGADIHKANGFFAAKFFSGCNIIVVSFLEKLVLEFNGIDGGVEGGVAAMVGPIGIDHSDFGDGGVAVFAAEIFLAELKVIGIHCKTVFVYKFFNFFSLKLTEAFKSCNFGGNVIFDCKGFGFFKTCFSCFNGVDYVFFDFSDFGIGKFAIERINFCGSDGGSFALGNDLDALCGGVCSLVKLTGKIFNRKSCSTGKIDLFGNDIELGLGKNVFFGVIKKLFADVFRVITVDYANVGKVFDSEKGNCVIEKGFCFVCKFLFLFNKNTIYQGNYSSFAARARAPISWR